MSEPVFWIDRPMTGSCRAIVPRGSVTVAGLREVCGSRTRPQVRPYLGETEEDREKAQEAGTDTGLDEITFGRQYTQEVATWLRRRGTVRVRAVHMPDVHCTPQCEGAWKAQEEGREHAETCTCRCGGYRHDTARPWFARHELLTEDTAAGIVYRIFQLSPLDGSKP